MAITKLMDESEIRRQLTRAREAYRLSPTEANARECERLYLLTKDGQQLKYEQENWKRRALQRVDITKVNQEAERGNPKRCVSCGWDCSWGAGHEVEDKDTGECVWLCCPCFERETLSAFAEIKRQRGSEADP